MQTRREFLGRSLLPWAAMPLLASAQTTPATRAPNVIVILTDDQGYGDLGCHGNPTLKTPHLDRLHAEGTRLTRFYTYPVCAPTRASLMTGRYSYRTGVVDTYVGRACMDPRERTLAESLRAAGYATGLFGKWHLGDTYPLRPMDRGFDESLMHKGGGLRQPSDPRVKSYYDPLLWRNGVEVQGKGYCTDIFTDAAIVFAQQHLDRPFFALLATNAPHDPLDIDPAAVQPYLDAGLPEDTAKTYAMITNLDANVGRLLDEMDRLGLREDTIVIFFTDNGAATQRREGRFNTGLRGSKGTVYEGGVRVPCVVRWPRALAAGRDHDRIASVIDLMPTLLSACGAQAPAGVTMDGIDLLPQLRDGAPAPERVIFTQWHRGDVPEPDKNAAAIGQQYKLVNGVELYDLVADPGETRDLAATQIEAARHLRAAYEAWFKDVCSTRGFDPVPLVIGSPKEAVTWLTAQDMRGVDGWGPKDLGFWALVAERAGNYRVSLHWPGDEPPGAGNAVVQLGNTRLEATLSAGATALTLPVATLGQGPLRLDARLDTASATLRPGWIQISRAD